MTRQKQLMAIFLGPLSMAFCMYILNPWFSYEGAAAVGTVVWMITWWILNPVDIYITALLPIPINAIFNLMPMNLIISHYFSEIVVLLFGADLICLTWATTGLGKRLSLKVLCVIGLSLKQQIFVWTFASAMLAVFLPKVVACALLTPVAIAMLAFVGDKEIKTSKLAIPILLAIAWGSGIGGASSPLGGAMNLVAINYIEEFTGTEFMYMDWVIRMLPFTLIILTCITFYIFTFHKGTTKLSGTKDYFKQMYAELGKMSKGEKISLTLFVLAIILTFSRPLFADFLPGMKPAYSFFTLGLLAFFLKGDNGEPLLTWQYVEKNAMWGLLLLFGGSLALGTLMIKTSAADTIANLLQQLDLSSGIMLIALFVVVACILAETSSNTASAAIIMPVVMSVTANMQLNPVPYWFITAMAFNSSFILPLTVRAIPVRYGLSVKDLREKGLPFAIFNALLIIVFGYLLMQFWPQFNAL